MTVNKTQQGIEITQTEQTSNEHSEVEVNLADKMKKELNGWGGLLIVLGIVDLALLSAPVTGIVLIICGGLNLMMRHRRMFIINGLVLMFVGLLALGNFLTQVGGTFSLFDLGLICVGIWEINKFRQYG